MRLLTSAALLIALLLAAGCVGEPDTGGARKPPEKAPAPSEGSH